MSMPLRTTAKVKSLRTFDLDVMEKNAISSDFLALAVSAHLAGRREEALKHLQRAVASNQTSPEIYRAMGHIQFEMGQFDAAERSYRTLAQAKPQYALGWFNLGVCLDRRGSWTQAVESFQKACALDTTQLDAWLALGICHLHLNDARSALTAFDRCVEIAPDNEDARFGKAAALQVDGQVDRAAELYEQVLAKNASSEESLSNLILIGMAKGDFDMVREYSERLLEHRPESTVALEGLAAWAAAANEHALTAKFCTLLVSAVPGHFEGWFNLGLAYQKSQRWEQAAEAYGEALSLRPQSSETCTNLGIVREQMGDAAGAREAYEQATQADPTALAPGWNLALLLEQSGELDAAEQLYLSLLERAPKEEEARFRLGYVRLEREDNKGAVEAFEMCLRQRPNWPEAQANLALSYARLGDRERAQRLYDRILDAEPRSADALRGIAALALQSADFETALEYHVRLIDLGDRSPEILYNAGLMYQKAGQAENAVRLYREALAAQADMPEALLNLGRVLESMGQEAEARVCWARALEVRPDLAQGYFGPVIE